MIALRPYQKRALRDTASFLKNQDGHPIIAMPTGTGKSLVIAGLIRYYNQQLAKRILILTHVKELIKQNCKATIRFCPQRPNIGVYSAGLGMRHVGRDVMFAGIASIHNKPKLVGHRDFVVIDECHLVPANKDTMYRRLLDALLDINPDLRIIGLSATPYRLDNGPLTKGGLFTDVCHDVTQLDDFNQFITDGFLSPLIACETDEQLSIDGVHRRGSDYAKGELQQAVDKEAITRRAVKELVEKGEQRKHWLIFTTGIKHNQHVVEELLRRGIPSAAIDSKCTNVERDERIRGFRNGTYRALVNANILTTGFDFPGIDLIGMLRPMCSPGLWVQSLGRGTRVATGKDNCLVLDYAGNTRRLGPINAVSIPYRNSEGKPGKKPNVKKCPKCSTLVITMTPECPRCHYVFPMPKPSQSKLKEQASTLALIAKKDNNKELTVDRVTYSRHNKEDGLDSIKVTYFSGGKAFREWLCFDHYRTTFPYRKATWWWYAASKSKAPKSVTEALERIGECTQPTSIEVNTGGNYTEVTKRNFSK